MCAPRVSAAVYRYSRCQSQEPLLAASHAGDGPGPGPAGGPMLSARLPRLLNLDGRRKLGRSIASDAWCGQSAGDGEIDLAEKERKTAVFFAEALARNDDRSPSPLI